MNFYQSAKDIENKDKTFMTIGLNIIKVSDNENELITNLNKFSKKNKLIEFIVLNEQMEYIYEGYGYEIKEEIISHVLKGEVYTKPPSRFLLHRPLIGLPHELNGTKYALFTKPSKSSQLKVEKFLLTLIILELVTGSFLIMITTKYLVHPISQVISATDKLAKANFQYRIHSTRKDELGKLTNNFNLMAIELERLEKMRKDFIANVSHEFKSPLSSIKGMAIAIKDDMVTYEEAKKYLSVIEKEASRLSNLTKQLLNLSLLESEKYTFSLQNYRLDDQIRDQIISLQPLWEEKKLEIKTNLPPIYIKADKDLLNNIWINLLTNAIKYNVERGKLIVEGIEKDSFFQITIQDTGIGIKNEDLLYIFERFYRVNHSHFKSGNSYGIGLSMVKKIIEIHQGDIKVSSKVGVGTKIEVILPKNVN
ncbi:HAMP domain-containing histidine kinase [Chengkuizengella sediminis]|nr:HAMP domain-containing histidine kinase [Chengkuizengella sediminis]